MESDFGISTVHIYVPLYAKVALVFTLLYPLWCVFTAFGHRRRPGSWFWRPGEPALLSLIPLFFNVPVVWLTYARVSRAMSLSGGGRAALSAGLAEALSILCFGAVVSAGTAALVLIIPAGYLFARRGRVAQARQQSIWRPFALVALVALLGFTSVTVVVRFAEFLSRALVFSPAHENTALLGLVVSSVVAAATAIIAARGIPKPSDDNRSWLWQSYTLLFVGLASSGAAVVIWRAIHAYRRIAIGLPPAA